MRNLNHMTFDCSGCFLCADICPVSAITINLDTEGFFRYGINVSVCTQCGLCVEQCPQLHAVTDNEIPDHCCAAYTKDAAVLSESASGGLFTELANAILREQGIVAGAAWVDGKVYHTFVESEAGLGSLRNSKYLQSTLTGVYQRIRHELDQNRKVLFSGLPCQVTALNNTIQHENLYTIDLICFGVPSRLTLDQSVRDQFSREITCVNFRTKINGWLDYYMHYSFTDGSECEVKASEDLWYQMYSELNFLNKSCYGCSFNRLPRHGDLSLGDFWGIEQLDPAFFAQNHNRGVSVVLVNSVKGKVLYNQIQDYIVSRKEPMDMAVRYNPRVNETSDNQEELKRRQAFFAAFLDHRVTFSNDEP